MLGFGFQPPKGFDYEQAFKTLFFDESDPEFLRML